VKRNLTGWHRVRESAFSCCFTATGLTSALYLENSLITSNLVDLFICQLTQSEIIGKGHDVTTVNAERNISGPRRTVAGGF
jgi:hypothetical protein